MTNQLPSFADNLTNQVLDFALPGELEAKSPPEARGLTRDKVGLMVSYRTTDQVIHTTFHDLPNYLTAGDVLVLNTSKTINAALKVTQANGAMFELHLSTRLPSGEWTVELRTLSDKGTKQFMGAKPGDVLYLPENSTATLLTPYPRSMDLNVPSRLWIAALKIPGDVFTYLDRVGFPIRYSYVREQWPLSYYQTVYGTESGSAEMPSAGRAFTPELITRLVAQGIQFAPLLLHTGVASLESHEPPYDEYFRVSETTAQIVNAARASGRRVIAVGTTAIRALESVTNREGYVHAEEGWTSLVITPQRGIHAINGLITGFHEPRASHLAMLEALAGRKHLEIAYHEALKQKYLWHEFGDLHLILP